MSDLVGSDLCPTWIESNLRNSGRITLVFDQLFAVNTYKGDTMTQNKQGHTKEKATPILGKPFICGCYINHGDEDVEEIVQCRLCASSYAMFRLLKEWHDSFSGKKTTMNHGQLLIASYKALIAAGMRT